MKDYSKVKRIVKTALSQTYGSFCYYCDTKLPIHKLTLDHIYPESKRGRKPKKNGKRKVVLNKNVCILACRECNLKKGNREISIEKFRKEIMGDKYYEISEKIKTDKPLKKKEHKHYAPLKPKPNYAQNIVYPKQIIVKRASLWDSFKDLFTNLLNKI